MKSLLKYLLVLLFSSSSSAYTITIYNTSVHKVLMAYLIEGTSSEPFQLSAPFEKIKVSPGVTIIKTIAL